MKFRIDILIPIALLMLSLTISLVIFFKLTKDAEQHIRQDAINWQNRDVTRLRNILYNRLTEDNYLEARLNISITAMDYAIKTIFLTDENHVVLLANRYLLEGRDAHQLAGYNSVIAQQVRKINHPNVFFRKDNNEILNGYYPVVLKLESDNGTPLKRVGTLFVESSIAMPLKNADHEARLRSTEFATLMIAISILLAVVLHYLISRRLTKLTTATRNFSSGNLEIKSDIGGNDELTELGRSFDDMINRIREHLLYREETEKKLHALNENLELRINERTALLREALRVANMGYWRWDVVNDTLTWSDEIYTILGYEVGEIAPSRAIQKSLIHPEDIEAANNMEETYLKGQSCSQDLRIITKNSELRWIHSQVISLKNEQNQVTTVKGILQDITQRKMESENSKKLEKQLLQAQKMESLGQLSGGIAHDFNNILASIMGFTGLLSRLNTEDSSNKLKMYADQITEAGNRGKNLVQQMLAFARTHDLVENKENIPAKELLEDTLSLLRPLLPSSIELFTEYENENIVLAADRDMIGQVITNLCVNARDSLPGEQGQITINVGYTNINGVVCSSCHNSISGSYIEICVEDSGHGITETSINRLFEPFYSTKNASKGSGMGLSIVHGILHKHNGHIIVESLVGRGAKFRCLFPVVDQNEDHTNQQSIKLQTESLPGQGQHILVIDDEIPITTYMNVLLTDSGYRVTVLNSSQQALDYFRNFHYQIDLVITDQTMPHMTGLQISQSMLTINALVPVIICTGFSELINEKILIQQNIAGVMYKPVDNDKLLQTINNILSSKEWSNPKVSN